MNTDDENIVLKEEKPRIYVSLFFSLMFLFAIWLVKFFESFTGIDLSPYGIYPRELSGLRGILFAPLVHSDYSHLISNTLTIAVLIFTLFYAYPRSSFPVFALIYIIGGLSVWIFARPAYHIGASGLIYGLISFFFLAGVLRRDIKSIAISLLMVFLYGSLVWGVLPTDPQVSYESHLSGALTGLLCAIIFRKKDELPPKYEWEETEENDDGLTDEDLEEERKKLEIQNLLNPDEKLKL